MKPTSPHLMKSIFIAITILLACKKDPPPTIIGIWALTKIEYWQAGKLTAQTTNIEVIYEFTNTTMAIMQDGVTDIYDIHITGSTIKVSTGLPFNIIELDNYTMALSKTDGDVKMKYYFEK